jgi:hypothetical protein
MSVRLVVCSACGRPTSAAVTIGVGAMLNANSCEALLSACALGTTTAPLTVFWPSVPRPVQSGLKLAVLPWISLTGGCIS